LPRHLARLIRLFVLVALVTVDLSAKTSAVTTERLGLTFATVQDHELQLDLYVPNSPTCLIVWVHGGRWWRGHRDSYPEGLVDRGYAVASVDYRLATQAVFPAQIHDIKAAIRFLRAHADSLGYPSASSSQGRRRVATSPRSLD
jgi:acetyl esterase/lipase